MDYFTADTHLGHSNIIRYCNRPFGSVEEMDEVLIANWNKTVQDGDSVFHLGDFCWGQVFTFDKYIRRLNGTIHIIPGGHDKWVSYFGSGIVSATGAVYLEPPLHEIKRGNDTIVLCHYAMRVWEKSHYGSYHLYGHSHGRLPGQGRSMDVGVDAHQFTPVSLRSVLAMLKNERNINQLEDK